VVPTTIAEAETCPVPQTEIELADGFNLQLNNADCALHNAELEGTANLNGMQRIFLAMYLWDNGGQAKLQLISNLLSYQMTDGQIPNIYDDIGDDLSSDIWANNENLGRTTLLNYVNGLLPAELRLDGSILNGHVQIDRSDYLQITVVIDNWLAQREAGHNELRNVFRQIDANVETAARDASFAVADSAGVNINFIKMANIEGHTTFIGSFSPIGSDQRYQFVFDATNFSFDNIQFSYSLRSMFDAVNALEHRPPMERVYRDNWRNLNLRNQNDYSSSIANSLYPLIAAAIPGDTHVYAPINTMVSQGFGRHNPIYPNGVHEGTDYAGGGVEFIAPFDCAEVNVFASSAYGHDTVTCRTNFNISLNGEDYYLTFLFAHAGRLEDYVIPGATLAAGTPIGWTGDDGERSTGPHLHLGVGLQNAQGNFLSDVNGIIFLNPELWVPDRNQHNRVIIPVRTPLVLTTSVLHQLALPRPTPVVLHAN
jgi:hypothetical protein